MSPKNDASAPGTISPNHYLPALTGLRAVVAYLVFWHHYNPAVPGTFAHRLFSQGYVGVSVFFVLSGFLIHHRYAHAYLSQKNWSWRVYLQNRLARIYPLYALLLLVTVLIKVIMSRSVDGWLVWLDGTLLNGFFDAYKFGIIPQSWSLTVEVTFYGLAPLLFVGLKRLGAFRLTALLISVGLLVWGTVGQLDGTSFFRNLPFVWFYTFFGRSFEFVVGMWLARQWHRNRLSGCRFRGITGRMGLGIVGICVVWQTAFTSYGTAPTALLWSEVATYNGLLPVGIGLLFVRLLTRNSGGRNWLEQPVFQALGRSSYAFYLIHVGVIANGVQWAGVENKGLLFILLIGIAHILYRLVEKPLNQWLRG